MLMKHFMETTSDFFFKLIFLESIGRSLEDYHIHTYFINNTHISQFLLFVPLVMKASQPCMLQKPLK